MPRQDAKIKFLRITAKNSSCKLIEMSQQLINERQISRTSKRSVKARKIKTQKKQEASYKEEKEREKGRNARRDRKQCVEIVFHE